MAASLLSLCNFVSSRSRYSNPSPPQLSFASGLTGRHRLGSGLSAGPIPVVYPSFAHSNTICFSSSYNVQVTVDENESDERLLGRFRMEVIRAGVLQECRRRRYFENKQEEKKRKTREAAKKNRRRRPMSRFSNQSPTPAEETQTKKVEEEDGDNWELPAGGIPY